MDKNDKLFEGSAGKLLTVEVNNQEYGIPILEAREVVGLQKIDEVPKTPEFMKGVINLRGKIIPIIDLRVKFEIEGYKKTPESCIIVVNLKNKMTGIIVDRLIGVVTVEKEEYETSLDLGSNIKTEFISGIVKLENRVIIVLEMDNILGNIEMAE